MDDGEDPQRAAEANFLSRLREIDRATSDRIRRRERDFVVKESAREDVSRDERQIRERYLSMMKEQVGRYLQKLEDISTQTKARFAELNAGEP